MGVISFDAVFKLIQGERTRTLFVDRGIVNCPRQGDIEVDACIGCPDFKRLRTSNELAVECSPPAYSGFDPTPFAWFRPFDPSEPAATR
jgi:hypothetical protein